MWVWGVSSIISHHHVHPPPSSLSPGPRVVCTLWSKHSNSRRGPSVGAGSGIWAWSSCLRTCAYSSRREGASAAHSQPAGRLLPLVGPAANHSLCILLDQGCVQAVLEGLLALLWVLEALPNLILEKVCEPAHPAVCGAAAELPAVCGSRPLPLRHSRNEAVVLLGAHAPRRDLLLCAGVPVVAPKQGSAGLRMIRPGCMGVDRVGGSTNAMSLGAQVYPW